MLLYYITDRSQLPGTESARRRALLGKISEAVRWGVDYVQLREKDLSIRDLEALAGEAVGVITAVASESGNRQRRTRLLINSRADVAIAVGADGVHLRSQDLSPQELRQIWSRQGAGCSAPEAAQSGPVIATSCHDTREVALAARTADFSVFAPVFEKRDSPGGSPAGLEALRQACQHSRSVLALGGVTVDNAPRCLEAGAVGIAGIRLFQENEIAQVVRTLRG